MSGSKEVSRREEDKQVAPWRADRVVWENAAYIFGSLFFMLSVAVVLVDTAPWGVWASALMWFALVLVITFGATWIVARDRKPYAPGDSEPVKARKVE